MLAHSSQDSLLGKSYLQGIDLRNQLPVSGDRFYLGATETASPRYPKRVLAVVNICFWLVAKQVRAQRFESPKCRK